MTATASSPDARQLWGRSRALLAALLVLIVFGVGYAVHRSGENHNALDPRSVSPSGSRAVAELLRAEGVGTTVVTTTAGAVAAVGPDSTLLVAFPDLLTPEQRSALHDATSTSGGRTVLLAPGPASIDDLAPGVEALGPTGVENREPSCALLEARRAGSAELGGTEYLAPGTEAGSCYPSHGRPTLLHLTTGPGDTVVLGAPDIVQNEHLAQQGNASLALQLLGKHEELVWYLPSLADTAPGDDPRNFTELIPDGWRWAFLQLLVAGAVTALWRARRLGPVVTERLPVVVRAAEATEGRARLYRRVKARSRAAEALRAAARDRLAHRLGLPPGLSRDPEALIAAVRARLGEDQDPGTDRPDARLLLHGPPPADDAALLRLAGQLDNLERKVRTS